MGSVYKISCKKCGYETECTLGMGMLDFCSENILKHFSSSADSEIVNILKNKEPGEYSFEYSLGFCASCKEYISVPTLTYKGKTLADKCSCNCNVSSVTTVEELRSKKICCDLCGSDMDVKISGTWD